jgi:hypothetical protein
MCVCVRCSSYQCDQQHAFSHTLSPSLHCYSLSKLFSLSLPCSLDLLNPCSLLSVQPPVVVDVVPLSLGSFRESYGRNVCPFSLTRSLTTHTVTHNTPRRRCVNAYLRRVSGRAALSRGEPCRGRRSSPRMYVPEICVRVTSLCVFIREAIVRPF